MSSDRKPDRRTMAAYNAALLRIRRSTGLDRMAIGRVATWSAVASWTKAVDPRGIMSFAASEMTAVSRRILFGRSRYLRNYRELSRIAHEHLQAWREAGQPGLLSATRHLARTLHV